MVMVVKMKVKVKVYEQIDTEVEDRGLIALSILVGKLQVLIFPPPPNNKNRLRTL